MKQSLMNNAFDIAFMGKTEEQIPTQLDVTGVIPEWVNGSLYRNGPGLLSTSNISYKHWFDGLAMIHRFNIQNGQVEYSSKYIETNTRDSILIDDTITYPEFATDPCSSIFKKVKSWFVTTNPKVNFTQVNDRFLALGETVLQLELDKDSLATLGVHCFSNFKYIPTVTTAHPHIEDSGLYNMVLKMGPFNSYNIIKYNVETQQSETICKIPITKPSYIHSIGMSENYFVLLHSPFECTTIDFIIKNRPFIENFKWNSKKKSKIWIIEKSSGKIIHKSKVDPFFSFHFINTYEEDDRLIFDIPKYPNANIIGSFYLENLSNIQEEFEAGKIERFVFDFNLKKIQNSRISDIPIEMVTIDNRYLKKDYTHCYGLGISKDGNHQFYDQIVKHNVKSGESIIWKEPDYYPGEPIFIPHINGTDDDDGVILSVLVNIKNREMGSKLLVLDAKTLTERASCYTPHVIVPGFHNYFIS